MLRLPDIVVCAAVLATAGAPRLTAQSVEIATRFGYSAPTGTRFQLSNGSAHVRSWDGGGPSAGASIRVWPATHLGIQGSVDFRFTRQRATYYSPPCSGVPGCMPLPGPADATATELAVSLRLVARQTLGGRLQLGASVGPAIIRFANSEYQAYSSTYCMADCSAYFLANHSVLAGAVGLSVAYALSSGFRLTIGADDVIYRVRPEDPSRLPGLWTSVLAPVQHEITFTAAAAVAGP